MRTIIFMVPVSFPEDIEAGDVATEMGEILDTYLLEDFPETKIGAIEIEIKEEEVKGE